MLFHAAFFYAFALPTWWGYYLSRQKYNFVFLFTGIEQLMSKFTAKRCPSLANKPKVFLIQACRGPAEDEFFTQSKDHKDHVAGLTCDSTLARCSSSCPQESDFFLGFATVPGYVAYKLPNYGSFYIQALTDIIKRNHSRYHLEEMLVEVNNSVSEKCNQVSAKHSTLRGKVFLWCVDIIIKETFKAKKIFESQEFYW